MQRFPLASHRDSDAVLHAVPMVGNEGTTSQRVFRVPPVALPPELMPPELMPPEGLAVPPVGPMPPVFETPPGGLVPPVAVPPVFVTPPVGPVAPPVALAPVAVPPVGLLPPVSMPPVAVPDVPPLRDVAPLVCDVVLPPQAAAIPPRTRAHTNRGLNDPRAAIPQAKHRGRRSATLSPVPFRAPGKTPPYPTL
jgi:hypothetical protein